MPREKKARLNIRVSQDLLKEAREVAEESHMTMTGLIEALLTVHIRSAKAMKTRPLDAEQI